MATELKLPDLGEGIEDVTINRWVVQEGGAVSDGDIILEVATDKVDTEVAATASGTLLKINFGEGELVPIDAVLAFIGEAGEDVSASTPASAAPAAVEEAAPAAEAPTAAEPAIPAPAVSTNGVKATPVAKRVAADKGVALSGVAGSGPGGQIMKQDVLDSATGGAGGSGVAGAALPGDLADVPSFIVRRAASEKGIDLEELASGRPLSTLTKYDVLSAAASRDAGETVVVEPNFPPPSAASGAAALGSAAQPSAAPAQAASASATAPAAPAPQEGVGEELVKPTRMRQLIAKNVLESLQNTAQVTTMWDVDMTAVLAHRKANKADFAAQGVKLTVTAYLMMGAIAGIRAVPAANSVWTDEGVLIKRYINLGMAAALPMDANGLGGLIVPVIKNAGDLNLIGMARAVNDLAGKARSNKLAATDLQSGTFTLSNYGTSGSRFQTPILTQPQVGILGVGATEKRAVVVSNGHPLEANMGDHLIFKPMTTLGFTYDHRVLDGATADAYCAAVKDALENWV